MQRILELFKGAFITRELPRFFTNSGKRLRKAPEIYPRDSRLLHAMLMLRDYQQLLAHPILGVSWEGFCIEQIIARQRGAGRGAALLSLVPCQLPAEHSPFFNAGRGESPRS